MKKAILILLVGLLLSSNSNAGLLEKPTADLPEIDPSEIKKEIAEQKKLMWSNFTEQYNRVHSVIFRINSANADLCDNKNVGLGFMYTNMYAIGGENVAHYPSELNIYSDLSVIAVAKNSPADKGGLKIGDKIKFVNGIRAKVGQGAVEYTNKKISEYLNLNKNNFELTILRVGSDLKFYPHTISMKPVEVCNYPLVFIPDPKVNAFADGNRIIITQGIAEYTNNDNELALVVGHELAHNTWKHINKKKINRTLAGIAGFLLDLGVAAHGGGYYGDTNFTKAFMKLGARAYSVGFEKEADYAGLYHAHRAGYDVSEANEFWRRMGARSASSIEHNSTHPATAERFVILSATLKEIESKESSGEPIIPNIKKKSEKKEKKKKAKKKLNLKKLFEKFKKKE